ncbi:hypothetical protein B7463_g12729, partial [Scytalidium lignicola]
MDAQTVDASSCLLDQTHPDNEAVELQERRTSTPSERRANNTARDNAENSHHPSVETEPTNSQNQVKSSEMSSPVPSPVPERVQENNRDEVPTNVIRNPSLARKFGKMAIGILVCGMMLILGAVGFLCFFWFANSKNSFWNSIILRDWLVKAVTISSEVIKQAVTFQLGVAGAILAALSLERFQVPLSQLASISIMRAGGGSGQLLFLSRKRFHRHFFNSNEVGMSTPVLMATIILGLIQVISVVLVSDIGLSSIPGKSNSTELNIGFTYYNTEHSSVPQTEILTRGTTWSRKPPFYPMFAEYSEPPFVLDGVDDTGLTLRAFLPFPTAQDRQTIRTYAGRTTVLDARVTCQVPILSSETIQVPDTETIVLEGSFQASRATPRLQNSIVTYSPSPSGSGNVFGYTYNESIPFQCLAPTNGIGGYSLVNSSQVSRWRLTICQLGEGYMAGGLSSEFVADVLPANTSAGFEEPED